MMASMARLSKDMNDAQRIVGGAMGNVEKSVASAKRAMQALGVGLPLAAITDQVRRMTDQYTKLDAQLRLATKSQASYAQGMADIRRISTVAQSDLNATAMLYTRLMNVMDGTGVSQAKLATVTETVSFGLKAYGATAQEASSAALQLSQAMGANRLGGEEFRAVMEAMPNVMKVLADSMGVPLGSLRQLSIEGKITAEEMVKAFGNPAVAAQFKAMAEGAQTITGAWIVARNELMLLIGEFMKSSGATSSAIAAFNGVGAAIRFLADNLGALLNALYAYVTVMGGKLVVGLVQARMAQMALNAAHGEAIAVNLAMARSEAANALAAKDAAAARALNLAGTSALNAARVEATAVNLAMARSEAANALAAQKLAAEQALYLGSTQALVVANARLAATELAVARAEEAAAIAAKDATFSKGAETAATNALTASNARLAASAAAVAAAEKAQAAGSIGIAGKIKGAVGKTGWIGLALFGIWSVVDFLNGMQDIADGAKKTASDLADLSLQQVMLMRQEQTLELYRMKHAFMGADRYRVEIRDGEARLKMLDDQVTKLAALANAEMAKSTTTVKFTHDEMVIMERYNELLTQFNDRKLTQAEFEARVHDLYGVGAKALKAYTKEQSDLNAQREASIKYEQDIVDGINAETDALLKKIEQERFDTEAIGKTKEQLALLQSVRYDNVTALQEQKLASLEANFASEAEIAAVREQIKARNELKGVWSAQATAQAAEAQGKAWKEIWDSVDKTAHDTFVSIMNGGKDTATRLKEAFKNGFFDWLYSMTLKKWIINIGTSAAGGASGAAMAGTEGGAGGSSWLSAGYNMFSTMKLGFDGVAAGFTELAGTISGGLQSMGMAAETAGTMGVAGAYIGAGLAGIQIGSMIAGDKKLAGMSGSTMSTIGATAGLILTGGNPLGALVGGAIGGALNAAFGRGPKVSGTTTLAGQFGAGGFAGQYQTPWSQSGGWFSSGRSGVDVTPLTVAQAKALNSIVAGGKSVFDNLAAAAGEAQMSLVGWTFAIDRQIATQEQQNQLIKDMSDSMGTYLVPQLAQFRLEGESLADTAVRMRDTFVTTDAILGIVGQTFNAIGFASMQMRANLIDLLGGVQQANASMQAYYQAFFTEEERAVNAWGQMAVALRQLGVTDIPTTNAQFRALIEAQDLNTASGQEAFAALISLSATFDALTRTTTSLTSQTTKLAANLNLLSTDSFATLVDYTRYVRKATAAGVAASTVSATPANDAFMQQVQQVLASAPAATPAATTQFQAVAAPITPSASEVSLSKAVAKQAAYSAFLSLQDIANRSQDMADMNAMNDAYNKYVSLPAFAGGGTHTGGLRLVGENGPELEYTGPSTIFSNGDTRNMLDNSGVVASVDALREELRALGLAIAAPIQKQYKLLDRWNGEGMPEVREA